MTYKAIIFDLDGTLVNSIFDIADAMNSVLAQRNHQTYDYETYKTFIGHGLKSLIKNAIPKNEQSETTLEDCLKKMVQVYSEICTNKTRPYNGVLELLDALYSKDLKIGILSNKQDALTKKVAAELLPSYIQPVIGLTKEHLKKPNPSVLISICKTLQVKPEEAIYVGDTNVDIQVAIAANIRPIGVSWGFRSVIELQEAGADTIINTPKELLQYI